MDDTFEIETLLKELEGKEVSAFYAFNEIRNILLDQKSTEDQVLHFRFLLKHSKDSYLKDLFLILSLTPNAAFNRMVIYELSTIIPLLDQNDKATMMKQIVSPFYLFPTDTKQALKEQKFHFQLTVEDLWQLLKHKQWQKILLFEEEIANLSDIALEDQKEALIEAALALDAQLTQNIHGEQIKVLENTSILEVLKRNPLL